eukprot:evm.model.scf_345.6 EVM.evm.TU.scf_345.6   scf_345:64944-69599(-)
MAPKRPHPGRTHLSGRPGALRGYGLQCASKAGGRGSAWRGVGRLSGRYPMFAHTPLPLSRMAGPPERWRDVSVAATAAAAVASAPPVVWVQWVLGIAAAVTALSLSIFLFAALSTLKAMRSAAIRAEALMCLLEAELPDTMSAVRLSSLEVSDCVEEFTGLGADLGAGLRASANAVSAAEKGLIQAAGMVKEKVVPALQQQAPVAREKLEASLKQRADMSYTRPLVTQAAHGTRERLRAARTLLNALDISGKALGVLRATRGRSTQPQSALKLGSQNLTGTTSSEDVDQGDEEEGVSSEEGEKVPV